MSAVVVSSYYESVPEADRTLFTEDKIIVVDSKVLMLDVYNEEEAYYVCGIINAPEIIKVVDGYAVSTNRGVDVLKYIAIPKYNSQCGEHSSIAEISKDIHVRARESRDYQELEAKLSSIVHKLFAGE